MCRQPTSKTNWDIKFFRENLGDKKTFTRMNNKNNIFIIFSLSKFAMTRNFNFYKINMILNHNISASSLSS